jgi:endo-beta-N-acetylglucosaminidase D
MLQHKVTDAQVWRDILEETEDGRLGLGLYAADNCQLQVRISNHVKKAQYKI